MDEDNDLYATFDTSLFRVAQEMLALHGTAQSLAPTASRELGKAFVVRGAKLLALACGKPSATGLKLAQNWLRDFEALGAAPTRQQRRPGPHRRRS